MYKVAFTSQAEADLARLDKPIAQRILKKIRWLAENFADISPEPLVGAWQGFFKLRVGDHRIIYTVGNSTILTIHFVRHRSEVYKTR
jgi:mRNA interferase RelE/StbE